MFFFVLAEMEITHWGAQDQHYQASQMGPQVGFVKQWKGNIYILETSAVSSTQKLTSWP